ncbi:winged helix-turn-helix domain-containing protein [Luteimonas sp. MC1572]|uniref:winged helix-turn-helix domain-containing protein n=1 Tax=Luteimonas sp. MC1572 TaxID=2799325 RepID=UPI0018F0F8E0|nr:winged helix-turn-helix domain-containing protein [Luteimonas sp. MC1572]MBJ6981402.1 PD40 domain-containing protein [Luteimonas sp. MC1572]QQO02715.1 PD40 domain-containing protein [Luteimonas sp. MC1572]
MSRAADDRSRDGLHRQQLRVGVFHVDAGALQVESGGHTTRLKPKAMAVLLALARDAGMTVSRDELLDEVWGSVHVTPGVVGHAITALRRAFGDDLERPTYIETIPRIGYRLIAHVEWPGSADAVEPAQEATDHDVTDQDADTVPKAVGGGARLLDLPPARAGAGDEGEASAAADATAPVAPPGDLPPQMDDARPRTLVQRWWPQLAAAAVALVAAALFVAGPWRGDGQLRTPAAADSGITAGPIRRVTFAPGSEDSPRYNPGGDWLVYSRRDRLGDPPGLFLQSPHGTEARKLAGGDHAERPAWSPDGREIAYVWRSADGTDCEIRMTSVDGGGQQTISECPARSIVYLDWNPADANQIAYSAITTGSPGDTRVTLLRRGQGWSREPFEYGDLDTATDLYPRFSPDGTRIAFRGISNPTSDLYSMSTAGGEVTRLTTLRSEIQGFDWLPDGSGLVFSSNHEGQRALYVLELADGRITALGITDASSPDIASRAWNLAFQIEDWRSALAEYPLDGGPRKLLAPSSGRDFSSAMSSDDSRLVFASDRDGSSQLWLLDRGADQATRLTRHESGRVEAPVLSADGRRVLYVLRVQGRHELHEFDFDRGVSQRVAEASASLRNAIYASDDRSIWYAGWSETDWRLHACRRSAGSPGCSGQPTQLPAFRVERAMVDGRSALLLAEVGSQGRVLLYAEDDLHPLRDVPLVIEEPWQVVGDAAWSLRSQGDGSGVATLQAHSLRDGAVTHLTTLRGARPLLGGGFQVGSDRRHVVLPVVTENRADIAVARLHRNGG